MTQALKMATVGGAAAPTYVDDVFSTWLYTGNGSSQTITNGINLSGEGGLVWIKARESTSPSDHVLIDTARVSLPFYYYLASNLTDAEDGSAGWSFNSNGFNTLGGVVDNSGIDYASWTFRQAPSFFDVVTYTGNGANRTIAHDLGVAPGCIMVKRTDTTGDWQVYHRSIANTDYLVLNSTAASATGATRWNSTTATSSVFSLGTATDVNANGGTYVAYLFAHDAATDGLIQCGSFTANGSGVGSVVTLGWEPQYLLFKTSNTTGNWLIKDNLRGTPVGAAGPVLYANTSGTEGNLQTVNLSATGFNVSGLGGSETYVYIAIRRPNKPPTVGTEVFAPVAQASDSTAFTTGFAIDHIFDLSRTGNSQYTTTRLTGKSGLVTNTAAAEVANLTNAWYQSNTGASPGPSITGGNSALECFRRAPGFFDVVCDTGTGSAHTVAHNLGAAPELIIRKGRSGATDWQVYCANLANTEKLVLNSTAAKATDTAAWNSTTPTASVFTVGTGSDVNTNGATYVSHLFATLAGISKVGSYTGNGSSQTINCGFTTGARFVLIKRTDSTGDWFVWDTARGIVSGNDPHLSLNTTAAEVTTNDTIDPNTSGFVVNQVAATNVNANAATYIYLAIA